MSQYDVLVVGGVGIDTIVRVPSLSLPAVDSIQVGPIHDYVAHTGNGVALGCHALGLKTKFIDFIGDDAQARLILDRYHESGLDFSYLHHESGTRRAVNLVDPSGRRLSLYDRRHPDELRMPRAFWLPFLESASHAHFSIMHWARDLYDDAHRLQVGTSTDLHDWDGKNPYHRDFALRSDIVFMSTAALGDRVDAVMRDILQHGRAEAVIAMAGDKGSYLLTRDHRHAQHFPCAVLPRPVVDTNGAGDSFVAGFLAAYFDGRPIVHCMQAGAVAGAFACGCAGTHEEFITRERLQALLEGV
ncbi:MAG TPA: carbohydrate kinase family protein [Noviherbaspirillum sp.]